MQVSPILTEIADKELLRSLSYSDLSLFNGQMGSAIFFALLSRITENHWYEDFAGELLDNICQNITIQIPINFAYGLCGIGWGIEFLKYRGFISDDTDEILSDIDKAVMERDVRRITDDSFDTGLKGIFAYVNCRLMSKRDNCYLPFDEIYLSEIKEITSKYHISTESVGMEQIWFDCLTMFKSNHNYSWKKGLLILSEHE